MRESTIYGERKAKSGRLNPKRKYFLFFEGVVTEVLYFKGIKENQKKLDINHLIEINVLGREVDKAHRANIVKIIEDIDKIKKDPQGNLRTLKIEDDDRIWIIFAELYMKNNKNHFLGFTNPCFELWLLLHFLDVSKESDNEKEKLLKNEKVSKQYRYVGNKVKEMEGNALIKGKQIIFDYYLDKIDRAIKNEGKLENEFSKIVTMLGSNIGLLISEFKS